MAVFGDEEDVIPTQPVVEQPAGSVVNVNDVSDSRYYMSPGELDAYEGYQRQQQSAPTGALDMQDYYPGFTPGGAVGTTSGSVIGTQSLFGGGGALVPIGMMDARDAAIQKAALQKAKEVDDFRKQFNKAPTSKLTNINEHLTNEYFDFHDRAWKNALRKSKGDPNLAKQIMQNDPEFWKKDKAFQDSAKMGDEIATKTAQDELDIRSGKFTPTPAYREMQSKLYKALNPSDPEFKNLRNIYTTMQIERDFSNSFDEVTKRMVAEEKGMAYNNDLSKDPDFIKTWHETVKQWSPEQKEGIEKTLIDNFYPQSDYWTPERIKQNVDYRTRGSQRDKKLTVQQAREEKGSVYDDSAIVSESGEKVNNNRGEVQNSYTEHFVPTNSVDQKKQLKFSVSDDMVSADGSPVAGGETGYVTGSVQGVGVKPYYKKEKRFLTDEEVKVMKDRGTFDTTKDIEMTPVAILNVTPSKVEQLDAEGNEISVPGEQKTIYFSSKKLAGVFKEGKSKKDYESMREKTETYAEEKNKNRSASKPAEKTEPKKEEKKAEDLRKKYNY